MTAVLRLMGVVTRPHGVRGEVKVRPETDDPARFEELERVYIGKDEESVTERRVEDVRLQPMSSGVAVVLTLEGVSDRDAAAALGGQAVFADQDDLPPLGDDEFYLSDLIGLSVFDVEGSHHGAVADVMELPAHPVLVIRRAGGADALVPFVPAFVEAVEVEEGRIVIRPVEGLLDPGEQEEVA